MPGGVHIQKICLYLFTWGYLMGVNFLLIQAQNLIPNPSFDQYQQCPPYLGQIHQAIAWDSPNFATSDYFHACSDSANGNGVPANRFGTQQPVSGEGYAGIRLWIPPGISTPNQREYIVTQLITPLEADSFYQVSFYVSLADFSTHTTDALGLGFSDTLFGEERMQEFEPAVRREAGKYLTERDSWEKISGIYQAQGGEQHVIIGNFLKDEDLPLWEIGSKGAEEVLAVYVYIDQVSVEPISLSPPDSTETPDPSCPNGTTFQVQAYDTVICANEILNYQSPEGALSYLWENESTDSVRKLTQAGVYQLTRFFPCDTVVTTITLEVEDCACEVFPQNVFSPNGDGINDWFTPGLGEDFYEARLTIVDRWGRRIYTGRNADGIRWNGQGGNGVAPEGVYYWTLTYTCSGIATGTIQYAQGSLVLVR